MKIRLMGTYEEVVQAERKIEKIFPSVEWSQYYHNRGSSAWVRVYGEIEGEDEDNEN